MVVYWHFFKLRFLSEFMYRANIMAFLLTQAVWLTAYIFLWSSIYGNGLSVGDYDFRSIMTYSMLTALFQFWTFLRLGRELAQAIESGDLNMYLTRPLSFLASFTALGAGRIGLDIILGIILITGLFIFFPHFLLVPSLAAVPGALVAMVIGVSLIVLMSLIIGQISFWVVKTGGLDIIFLFTASFLAGDYLPIDLFPPLWQTIILWTPFPYMMWFPLQVLLGRSSRGEGGHAFTIAVGWLLVLAVIVFGLRRFGLKRYEAVSG